MKVVISGANGFVGSNLTTYCLSKGCDVTALVRKSADVSLLPSGFEATKVDYHDTERMRSILQEKRIFVHNAAITRGKNWQQFHEQNVELTAHLVNLVNETDSIEQFIFISSQAAAGVCQGTKGRRENEECYPVSYYGKSKLLAEEIIMKSCRKNWTIIRPASVFGPGDHDFLQYFKLVQKGISFLIGFRPRYISLIPISALVEMLYKTFGNEKAYNEIFFASCDSYKSWDEFITALEEAMSKKTRRIRIPEFMLYPVAFGGEIWSLFSKRAALLNYQKLKEMKEGSWICDAGKARQILGFIAGHDLTEELKKTYQWYREKGWL